MSSRRLSKAIRIGGVIVGGGAPVVVQSMTMTDTRDVKATVQQIRELEESGCELIRVAVPDQEAAEALGAIKKGIGIPLIADIHFDHRLALTALTAGVDGLRLNPGNIADQDQVATIVRSSKERNVPIRIGVNAGSLPPTTEAKHSLAERMVAAALGHIKILEGLDFDLIKISLKAFDVPATIEAYRLIAEMTPYPLHLGITEAGLPATGIIRSAVGIGTLLHLGLGDTIRVSLTTHPQEEVIAGYEILKSLGLRERGPVLVSCPQCGRAEVDVLAIAEEVSQALKKVSQPIRVAVMGCAVNGPGEAKDADVGLACGKEKAILFRHGQRIAVIEKSDFVPALMREIATL
ncbi:MAG: flavodoxin-dependent (E)-4-hydroxy-3-methylbut-2-enyl-diphosphate synthase [Dehalococcoidia bacterium]|nr:flavodoxin-dependent (E)-4-hydroxy-3-methylbut-2-enyl-diphosphate synthase [Dehalococcoidia bacterium]